MFSLTFLRSHYLQVSFLGAKQHKSFGEKLILFLTSVAWP